MSRPHPLTALAALFLATGCQSPTHKLAATTSQATTSPSEARLYDAELESLVRPPTGWHLDPPKRTRQHVHKTWVSPTGDSAYGIIRFNLPLPLNEDLCLWGFMNEMRRSEGEGILVSKAYDPALPGIRFVAEGGLYKIRTNMLVSGFSGWCVYAGSLRARPENTAELTLAADAREATSVNVPAATTRPTPDR